MQKGRTHFWQDKQYPDMWNGWFTIAFVATIIVLLSAIIVPTIQAIDNSVSRTNCRKFGQSSGYETDFAYYGFWKNECFVILPNGNKIPQNQLINNQGN